MKRFVPILALGLMACAVAVGYAVPTSCSVFEKYPGLKRAAVPLAQLGLALAAREGVIEPGDSIDLVDGVAVLVSDKSGRAKILELTELGVNEALEKGVLQEGDRVIVRDLVSAVVIPASEESAPEGTSAKEPVPNLEPPPQG